MKMWETKEVTITVRLPRDLAEQAEKVNREEPEFLSRVVLYGLTRRSIYRHLRENEESAVSEMEAHVFTPEEQGRLAVRHYDAAAADEADQ